MLMLGNVNPRANSSATRLLINCELNLPCSLCFTFIHSLLNMHRFTAVAALFTIILFAGSGFVSAQSRRITFNNLCSYPVWFGFVSGAVPLAFCSTGCPNGSHCDPTNNNCYWDAPTPDNGNYKLLPNASNSATLHFINNSQSILWSGAITGRTGCRSGAQCTVADCGTPNPDTDG